MEYVDGRAAYRDSGGGGGLSVATAQALARLETSVAIWFLLLVIYHVIRRWMLINDAD